MSQIEGREASQQSENTYRLSPIEGELLHELSSSLPPPLEENFALAAGHRDLYREALAHPELAALHGRIEASLAMDPTAAGFIHITGMPEMDYHQLQVVTMALSTVPGTPVHVYEKADFQKRLGTKLDKNPSMSEGIGLNPLHVDAINTTHPPQFVTFTGILQDPAGGGLSTVSHVPAALERLSPEDMELLAQPVFSYGQFYGIHHAGAEYDKFPAIQMRPDGLWHLRYTGKGMDTQTDDATREAVSHLRASLEEGTKTYMIGRGDISIVNQILSVHGRLPLGPGQEQIPQEKRRMITQVFVQPDSVV